MRSDLAQRFRVSVGELVRRLGAEHDEVLDRVRYALAEVDRLRTAAESERAERGTDLSQRRERLQALLAALASSRSVEEASASG